MQDPNPTFAPMAQPPSDHVPSPAFQPAAPQGGSPLQALSLSPVALEVQPQFEPEGVGQVFVPPADPPQRGLSPSFGAPYGVPVEPVFATPSAGIPAAPTFTAPPPPLHHGLVEQAQPMPFSEAHPHAPALGYGTSELATRVQATLEAVVVELARLGDKVDALGAADACLVGTGDSGVASSEGDGPAADAAQLLDRHARLMGEFAAFALRTGLSPFEFLLKVPAPIPQSTVATPPAQERSPSAPQSNVEKPSKPASKETGGELKTSPYPDEYSDEEWTAMTVQKRGSITRRKQKAGSADGDNA